MQHHNYSLSDLENMMPWEREVYVGLLIEHLEEEKKEQERNNRINRNGYTNTKCSCIRND